MSTLSSANVTDVNLVLKECAYKIKMKYSMHQYSNSYVHFRQLANSAVQESERTIIQFYNKRMVHVCQNVSLHLRPLSVAN